MWDRSELLEQTASRQAAAARVLRTAGNEEAARRAERWASFARLTIEHPWAATRTLALARELNGIDTLRQLLDRALEHALVLTGADFGNIQLLDRRSGQLRILAQRGFGREFLEHFSSVDLASACGRAAHSCTQTVITDVQQDAGFEPHRAIAARAGFRAVQSTPLLNQAGRLVGVLSTHFREPGGPSEVDLWCIDQYAELLAEAATRLGAAAL